MDENNKVTTLLDDKITMLLWLDSNFKTILQQVEDGKKFDHKSLLPLNENNKHVSSILKILFL